MGKNFLPLITIGAFVALATSPLLHEGFPPTHDGEYHVIRFYEFYKTLASGEFYPRWSQGLNNGFGLPLFNFVYPLPNYVAAIFHTIGYSFIDSFKYSLIMATLLGAIGFYYFAKYFTGKLAATVGAILYVFTPYRFVDIYVRGSIGELWSLAFIPLLLWSLAVLIKEKKLIYFCLSALFFTLLIFSHNILAVLFSPFLITYIVLLILQNKKKKISSCLAFGSVLLGLGSSSLFWLPALLEKRFTRGLEVYDYKTSFTDLASLLFPSWGTGFAGEVANGMSTQIGSVNLLIIFMSLIVVLLRFSKQNKLYLFSLVWIFLVILLMLPLSVPVWEAVPLFSFVQFPWRYLSLLILLCSLAAAFLIAVSRFKKISAIILVAFAVFTTIHYTKPAYYHDRDDSHYLTRANFTQGTNSPGNAFNTLWIDRPLKKKDRLIEVISGKGNVSELEVAPERYFFRVDAAAPLKVLVNTAYFPGWRAYSPGNSLSIERSNEGLMQISLPEGEYFVTMKFADTMVRSVGLITSFLSFLIIVGTGIYSLTKKPIL